MKRLIFGLFLLAACGDQQPIKAAAQVGSKWLEVRTSTGHLRHLKAQVACLKCHKEEDGKLDRPLDLDCSECHEETPALLHDGAEDRHEPACLECHSFSAETVEPWDCARCHDDSRPKTETNTPVLAAHSSTTAICSTCHAPHSRPISSNAACASCHQSVPLMHGGRIGDEACIDCHLPHQAAKQAVGTCARCHQHREENAPQVASVLSGHQSCADCHLVHRDPAQGIARAACVSCHVPIREQTHANLDRESCAVCHAPHGAPPAPIAAPCESCHVSPEPPHAGDTRCVDCHDKHAAKSIRASDNACGSCHIQVKTIAPHERCASCHPSAGHAASEEPASCASCHEKISRKTLPDHQQCADCHPVHEVGKKPTCASCHEVAAKSKHGTIEGGCKKCHEVHAAARAPACNSCHKDPLGGLHQLSDHARCDSCHEPHVGSVPDRRETCLSCHVDLGAHEPSAKRCATCHPFVKSAAAVRSKPGKNVR